MTIAIVVKVNDGYVLASDSATTVARMGPSGEIDVANIYNNANKIFNLRKGLPISAMTWGLGNIGPASISTLAKDLRRRFAGSSREHPDWTIDPDEYSMKDVADRFKQFFYDEHYAANGGETSLGLLVSGYSSGATQPEMWAFEMTADGCAGPVEVLPGDTGAQWWGQPEAISRLMLGVSNNTPQALVNLGVPEEQAGVYTRAIADQVNEQLVGPAMPIQDAVDLAKFLVEVTIGFVRFCPGHPLVGGPIEIAAVTQHEGFNWVQRKHYFDSRLNPPPRESPL